MTNPIVGIIVLHWNGFEDTRECLNSLLRIQYPNIRIYVIDNHSPDQVGPQLIKEFGGRIIMITNPTNLGYAGGNNVGIKHALADECDAVLLLNNDTTVAPDFLGHLVQRLYSDSSIGIVGPKIMQDHDRDRIWFAGGEIRWQSGVRLFHTGVNQTDNQSYQIAHPIDFMTGCCLLIKHEAINRVGMIPEEYFLYFEDADWSVAVTRAGYKIWYEPAAIIWHKEVSEGQDLSPTKTYYLARNYLRFALKYANWYQAAVFIPAYFIYYGWLFLKNTAKGRFDHNRMIGRGIRDYVAKVSGQLSRPRL